MPKPSDYESRDEYLFKILNKYGFDVEISCSYKNTDGTIGFSKWVKYSKLMELDENESVFGGRQTKKQFIDNASHRTVMDIEVVLDLDGSGKYISIRDNARETCRILDKHNISYASYFTGSKSYHIHILLPELRSMDSRERKKIKQKMLFFLDADVQKSAERNMIALEGAKHYKSGKKKIEVCFNDGFGENEGCG